jgi:hypothetical protein
MPLNKFAAWGVELALKPRPPGLGAVVRSGLRELNETISKGLPPAGGGAQPPLVKTPTATALRIVWSLNAVRDALSDQGTPTVADTNTQIEERQESEAVGEIQAFLEQHYPRLAAHYREQFRTLEADTDDFDAFDLERRERLAELASFELVVMASVGDLSQNAAKKRAARRSSKRR